MTDVAANGQRMQFTFKQSLVHCALFKIATLVLSASVGETLSKAIGETCTAGCKT